MATEDFTTYTTSGSGPSLTITASKVQVVDTLREHTCLVYRDLGASHFGATFEHLWELVVNEGSASNDGCYAVSNTITGGMEDWEDSNVQAIAVNLRHDIGIELWGCEDNVEDFSAAIGTVDTGVRGYMTVERTSETACELRIYSDSGRTTLLDTLTVAVTSGRRFQYILPFIAMSAASVTGRACDYDIENLDLQEAGGAQSPLLAILQQHGVYLGAMA